jgi:hypothetical protein
MPALQERRTSPRLDAVKNRARIEIATPSGLRRAAALLVNISQEGALIIVTEAPPLHERLWMRMEEPAKTDWVAAVAVRHRDWNEVGLRFPGPRPDDLLLAATLGIDFGPTLMGGPRPESVDDFVW